MPLLLAPLSPIPGVFAEHRSDKARKEHSVGIRCGPSSEDCETSDRGQVNEDCRCYAAYESTNYLPLAFPRPIRTSN
jgi:hypothetical protein